MSKQEGDARFSALNATFNKGTIIDGVDAEGLIIKVDVGGMTIEDVYQKIIKKSGKGMAPAKDSIVSLDRVDHEGFPMWIDGYYEDLMPSDLFDRLFNTPISEIPKSDKEDFSYYIGYLPLWQKWAEQNPELIEELRINANGKTLTDRFADKTTVSQARALADILNSQSQSGVQKSINTNDSQLPYNSEELKEFSDKDFEQGRKNKENCKGK